MKTSAFRHRQRKKKDNVARHSNRSAAHHNKFTYAPVMSHLTTVPNEFTEGSLRCPECRPTQDHTVNPDCRLCGGDGQTDLGSARGHILGEL